MKKIAFEAPFGRLGVTYDVHLRLTRKLVDDFLLVIIELFSLGAVVLLQSTRLTDRQNLDSNTVRMLRGRTVIMRLPAVCEYRVQCLCEYSQYMNLSDHRETARRYTT